MAVDVKTGKQVWKTKVEYPPETPRIVCCGIINRGAAIYEGKIFRTTLDANVIALDAKTGKEVWRQKAADIKEGYSMTVAPLVADGVVLTGISGAEFGTRGFIDGWDPETGKHLWRTHTVPTPDEPGGDTWKGDTWKLGGGSTWITGSYDPELNTVYWGIGNPGPFNAAVRPGDNLYTCSVLALEPKTGKIKWHYQFSPNNPFDYDSVAEMVLADLNVERQADQGADGCQSKRLLLRARPDQREAARGQSLCEGQLGFRHRHEDRPSDRDGRHQGCPRRQEGHRLSVHPRRQELGADVVRSADRPCLCQYACLRRPLQDRAGDLQGGRMVSRHGPDRSVGLAAGDGPRGHLKAIDPLSGKTKWEVGSAIPRFSGVLSTAGGVVFSGQLTGEFEAFDANDGKKLWQFQTGSGIEGQPVTWQQDGVQYVAVTSGYGGVYSMFSGDERLAKVPAGGSLWVFAVKNR